LTQGIARGTSNEVMFKQIGVDVLKTGDVVSAAHPSYGKHGYRLAGAGTATAVDIVPIFGVDNSYGLFGNNTEVLVVGSNGASLPVLSIWRPLHPNGKFYIIPSSPDAATAVLEFNTLFPNGTTLKYYATTYTTTKHNDTTMVCDIIGDVANYPAHWLTAGVFGSPMLSDQDDNLVTLAGGRRGANGGYIIPLKKKVPTATNGPGIRVLVTTNGITTELPYFAGYTALITTGTYVGYYLYGPDNTIRFNLTGTGAHDAAIEAATVIQVFYSTEADYTKSALDGVVVAEGTGYVSNYQAINYGNALTGMLTGRVNTNRNTAIAGATTQEFGVPPRSTTTIGSTGSAAWMRKPKHATLDIPHTVKNSTKMLPYLTIHDSVAELNVMYKELRYKSMDMLTASDAQASDYFGRSVTLSGTRLVVGANAEDTAAVNAGKVYVYDWNGSAYIEVAQLTASDAQASDQFGVSVALSGTRLVVGANTEDTAAVDAGKVYVYDWNGAAYIEVAQLTASDAQANDQFGVSVALSGNRLVVGAHGEDTAGLNAGKVYVYDWNGTAYVEVAQLTASDAQANDYFGRSVALSGNRLVVGAHLEDTAGLDAGKVYAYGWSGTAYIEIAQLTATDAQASDQFGVSVALSGNRLVVGANTEDTAAVDAGKVYVYDWISTAYVEVAQLVASDAHVSDTFGASVTLSGNRLVVGARFEDTAAVNAGKVYSLDLHAELTPGLPAARGYWGDNDVFELTLPAAGMQDTNDQTVRYGTKAVKLKRFLK